MGTEFQRGGGVGERERGKQRVRKREREIDGGVLSSIHIYSNPTVGKSFR